MSTAPIWISLLTLAVTSAVALIVAAMHRKQMRQIELRRTDPTVPVVPPLHPITEFLRRNFHHVGFIITLSFNGVFLIRQLLKSADPPTRDDVLSIALFTGGMFLAFATYITMWSVLQTFKAIDICVEGICNLSKGFGPVTDILSKGFGPVTDVLKKHAEIMKNQADLLGVLAIKHAVGKDEPPPKKR